MILVHVILKFSKCPEPKAWKGPTLMVLATVAKRNTGSSTNNHERNFNKAILNGPSVLLISKDYKHNYTNTQLVLMNSLSKPLLYQTQIFISENEYAVVEMSETRAKTTIVLD